MSKRRRHPRLQRGRSNEQQLSSAKAPPIDGIFLDGDGKNWELFERLYKETARRTFGRLVDELDLDEDIRLTTNEPDGDPNSFEYKMEFERLKILTKIEADMTENRFRLFGDIMTHLSFEAESRVRGHADFREANDRQSPRLLWTIVRQKHIAKQHAGDLGKWFGHRHLYTLQQESTDIEAYGLIFKAEFRLRAMGDDVSEQEATQVFITSLNGQIFAEEVARWATVGEVPDSLDEAIRKVEDWYNNVHNARESMSNRKDSHHEAGFKARIKDRNKGKQETVAAAGGGRHGTGAGGGRVSSASSRAQNCPICKKRSKHAPEDCWELEKFCQQAKDKKASKSRPKEDVQGKGDAPPKGDKKPSWMFRVGFKAADLDFKGIYLDTGATISLWDSRTELTRTYKIPEVSILGINGESTSTTAGEHPIWGKVVVLQDCPYKLISIRQLRQEGFRVDYSHEHDSFKVTSLRLGLKFYFDVQDGGLYQLRDDDGEPTSRTDSEHHAKAGIESLEFDTSSAVPPGPLMEVPQRPNSTVQAPAISDEPALESAPESVSKEITFTKFERAGAQAARDACKALGHVGKDALIRAIKAGANLNVSVQDVHRAETIFGPCPGCKHGKVTSTNRGYTRPEIEDVPSPVNPNHHQEILHADLFYVPAAGKALHIIVMSVGQRHRLIVLSKISNKTKYEVSAAWSHHLSLYKRHDVRIREIHTDNEVNLSSTRDELGHRKVKLIQSASQTHEKYCERRVRVVKERMRAVLSDLPYLTPKRLYYRLALWVVQGINCVPDTLSDPGDVRSARERVTGKRIDMKMMTKYFFGQFVLYHIANNDAANIGPRAGTGIVVARDLESGNFLVFNPATDSTVARKALTPLPITEDAIKTLNSLANHDDNGQEEELERLTANDTILSKTRESYAEMSDSDHDDSDYSPSSTASSDENTDDTFSDEGELHLLSDDESELDVPTEPTADQPRYSLRQNRGIGHALMSTVRSLASHGLIHALVSDVPQLTPAQGIAQYGDLAVDAIRDELSKMLLFKAFVPVRDGQPHTIPSSMFLKIKQKADGTFDKVKARLVAGGHRQYWHAEDSCSSPTIPWDVALGMFATAARNELLIVTVDIPSAYLQAWRHLCADVFMKLSKEISNILVRLEPQWSESLNTKGELTVKLQKALYGLKESGLLWFNELCATLSTLGFTQSYSEPCLFLLIEGSTILCIVGVYVDDLLIMTKDQGKAQQLITGLENAYGKLEPNFGPTFSFVGTAITQSEDRKKIHVSCPGYISSVAKKFGIQEPFKSCPAPSRLDLVMSDGEPTNATEYASIVMSLMYACLRCRPDALYMATFLTTKCKNPTTTDLKTAYHVASYLVGTPHLGLLFDADSTEDDNAFADAAFAPYHDAYSHTGGMYKTCGAPTIFMSKKQSILAKSSCSAEIVAADALAERAIALTDVYSEMGMRFTDPVPLHQDNQAAIAICKPCSGSKIARRPRAMRLRISALQTAQGNRHIKMVDTRTDLMQADGLTKPLRGAAFERFVDWTVKPPF